MAELANRLQQATGGAYRIEKELGGGGMSRVFLAEEVRLGRQVVIKVLPPDMAAGVNVERFEREIRLAAKLQHPHVVPLLTAGSEGDLLYYVMPFIRGESLRAKLAREGELPIGEAVRILRDVADALAYAHGEQVVHRDIKPDNVLLSGNHALVTDFGVAKAVSASTGESSLTSLGVALGTPAYMSPEQAAADPHVDHRADIYAVGALAYEMLTGRPPFTAPSPQTILAAHVTQEPDPIATLRVTVPPALSEIVHRCLAKKAADRWQRAEELRGQLEVLATPSGGLTPTGSRPVGAVDLDAVARRAHPLRVGGLFGLAAVGVLGIVVACVTLLGLPEWVLYSAGVLLIIGLPIVLVTAHHVRRRAGILTTGAQLPTPTGLARHLTFRKAILGGVLAFGGLALVSLAYMAMRVLGIGPAATLVTSGILDQRERIVLAQFANTTPDSALGETITELFRIDLSQSPTVIVLEPGQISSVLRRMERDPDAVVTAELADEIAEREGIKAYVSGEIRPIGSGFVISGRLVTAATGEALWAAREQAADPDGLVSAVDRLSGDLRARVGESLRTIRRDAPLEAVTTHSTEALRLYAQGVRADNMGDNERSISLFEQAIAVDSTFAMAWRKLGVVLSRWGRDPERQDSAVARAFALRDRLTERERLIAEGSYHRNVTHDQQAEVAAYQSLLERYPTDPIGLNNLGNAYTALGRHEEATALYVRSVGQGGAPSATYQNAIAGLNTLGLLDSAAVILERYAEAYPEQPNVRSYRADFASARGDYEEARRQLDALRDARRGDPSWEMAARFQLANLAAVAGKLTEARRHDRDAFDAAVEAALPWAVSQAKAPRWTRDSTTVAWQLLDFGGDLVRARAAMDGAVRAIPFDSMPVDHRPYGMLALFYARAGDPARARAFIDRFDREVVPSATSDNERKNYHEWSRTLLMQVAVAEGRYDEAIDEYWALEAERDAPTPAIFVASELARIYDEAGNADSALANYERYVETPWLFRLNVDSDELWRALKRLGELYEARGNRERALAYYGRFVELWRDADPELQSTVDVVRARVERLTAEGG